MTAVLTAAIRCDHCNYTTPARRLTATRFRTRLEHAGWHRVQGVDWCPSCWPQRQQIRDRAGAGAYYPRAV